MIRNAAISNSNRRNYNDNSSTSNNHGRGRITNRIIINKNNSHEVNAVVEQSQNNNTPRKKIRARRHTRSTPVFLSTFIRYACLMLILLIATNVFFVLEHTNNAPSNNDDVLLKQIELFRMQSENNPSNLHEGQTLKDALQRILSRKIAASNVLIITPDGGAVNAKEVIAKFKGGAGVLVHETAEREGHSVHALHPRVNVDAWWKNDHDRANQNWFLLAFISGDMRHANGKDSDVEGVDRIMRSANHFLNEATVTYMVLEVGVLPASSDNLSHYIGGYGGEQIIGRGAVKKLFHRKYKVQILVSSHFLDNAGRWGPNVLLTSYNIDAFFQDAVRVVRKNGETFQSYLFATQGLDLAIPAARGAAIWDYESLCGSLSNECGNGNCGIYASNELGVRPSCPVEHSRSSISFKSEILEGEQTERDMASIELMYDGKIISNEDKGVSVWLNDMKHPERAEAACMRMEPDGYYTKEPSVACTTRIIKQQQQEHQHQPKKKQNNRNSSNKNTSINVLSILIDPISRTQFLRSLPRTAALLEEKQFVRFENYMVVGANSGPNQAALFSGEPLTNGRNGISSSASHGIHNNTAVRKTQWIWDELRSSGYITFKAEDGCIENSNMIQSLKPNVTHGSALHEMFCFSYDRPNCLGDKLAAEHLFDAAGTFINAYSGEQPWAAFLSFTDSHEDSLSMIQILDDTMYEFISGLDLSNMFVMVLSDHGLHYGPHFQTPAGLKERAQPILYMHLPDKLENQHAKITKKNAKLWTSHFDVHETLLDIALGINSNDSPGVIGSSLLKPLANDRLRCDGAPGVPSEYCDIVDGSDKSDAYNVQWACRNIPPPPSPMTFLADLPLHRQPKLSCNKLADKKTTTPTLPLNKSTSNRYSRWTSNEPSMKNGSCKCATESSNGWYDCQRHPWHERNKFDNAIIALTYCKGDSKAGVEVDVRIEIAQRKNSSSRRKSMIRGRQDVDITGLLTDANQFLQRQMLCADSIISNLKVSAPPPVSWSVYTI